MTDQSRQDWLRWNANLNPDDNWLNHDGGREDRPDHGDDQSQRGGRQRGRGVGDDDVGAVVEAGRPGGGQSDHRSHGRRDAIIKVCGAFAIVELMQQGVAPEEACLRTLERAVAMTESRLLDANGRPRFDLHYYAVRKDGAYGSAALYEITATNGYDHFAVADASGARLERSAHLYSAAQRPKNMLG